VRFLLDTHALIWILTNPGELSEAAIRTFDDVGNEFLVSSVSIMEISIKRQLGRASAPPIRAADAMRLSKAAGCGMLDFSMDHAVCMETLATHHHDPFDRMLISQAKVEMLTLMSRDRVFEAYGIQLLRC
jgi:PIN domain nuclease of toxin-antitoxin system